MPHGFLSKITDQSKRWELIFRLMFTAFDFFYRPGAHEVHPASPDSDPGPQTEDPNRSGSK